MLRRSSHSHSNVAFDYMDRNAPATRITHQRPARAGNPTAVPQKAESAVDTQRLTAHEIFDATTENARSELRRSWRSLAVSGFAAGITLGLTGIGVASVRALVGDGGWQQ